MSKTAQFAYGFDAKKNPKFRLATFFSFLIVFVVLWGTSFQWDLGTFFGVGWTRESLHFCRAGDGGRAARGWGIQGPQEKLAIISPLRLRQTNCLIQRPAPTRATGRERVRTGWHKNGLMEGGKWWPIFSWGPCMPHPHPPLPPDKKCNDSRVHPTQKRSPNPIEMKSPTKNKNSKKMKKTLLAEFFDFFCVETIGKMDMCWHPVIVDFSLISDLCFRILIAPGFVVGRQIEIVQK